MPLHVRRSYVGPIYDPMFVGMVETLGTAPGQYRLYRACLCPYFLKEQCIYS